jgi:hypothetical protein
MGIGCALLRIANRCCVVPCPEYWICTRITSTVIGARSYLCLVKTRYVGKDGVPAQRQVLAPMPFNTLPHEHISIGHFGHLQRTLHATGPKQADLIREDASVPH